MEYIMKNITIEQFKAHVSKFPDEYTSNDIIATPDVLKYDRLEISRKKCVKILELLNKF